jgi:dihydropyrimidine dehydrogenase (NAD+) subunit PreA
MEKKILDLQGAVEEADRCLLCFDAPCNTDCGADTKPADFIRKLKFGNIKGAVKIIRENNLLGAVCAHVCPTCRLCEKGCSRSGIDVPIRINDIQAFLMDYERKQNMKVLKAPQAGDKKIVVIGSGPAGLSAAGTLAMKGYDVTIIEKAKKPGGILRYGIPSHRLPSGILDFEISVLEDLGIKFQFGEEVSGENGLLNLLDEGFDGVFVSVGLDAPYSIKAAPCGTEGVYSWAEFLASGIDENPQIPVNGKNVVIIGGGSVALDCAVSAKKAGAERVYCVSLEAMEELPADREEIDLAIDSGIRFRPNCRVKEIVASDGKVSGVKGGEIKWIVPGCFVPDNAESVPGSDFSIPADIVVEAIGTGTSEKEKELLSSIEKAGAFLIVDPETMKTSIPKIFAGGDVTGVGKTVAACVKDGKKAAEAIAAEIPLSAPAIIPRKTLPSLEVDFCGVKFPNPFCLSASPVGNTAEMCSRAFDAGWGGIVFKTLNLEKDFPIIDPTPRLNALDYNSRRMIGLQNIEMVSERPFAQNLKDIAWLKKNYPDKALVISIMGYSPEGWIELATGSEKAGADMLELNFSCPQMAVEGAGHKVGQSYEMIKEYTRVVKDNVSIPVMAKMTPNITDMLPVAIAAQDGGADAISAINTLRAITEVNLDTYVPMPSIEGRGSISGYSGPSCKPIALRFIAEMAKSEKLYIPISGLGGIETWKDAAMFLMMGATTLQATTSIMRWGYRIAEDLNEGLQYYLLDKGFDSVNDIIGIGISKLADPSEHHQKKHVISSVDQDKCIGCGLCHIVCHDGANQAMKFDIEKRKAEVTEERCVGCLLCRHVCPVEDCISTKETDEPVAGGMHEDAMNFIL